MAHAFPETHWSRLVALKDSDDEQRRDLLQRLAESYWAPIYHYVRAMRRVSKEDAQDHTQQFFAHLLERGRLDGVDRERGSFRGFLRTAVRNFLIDADRAARARPLNVPYADAESVWLASPDLSPEEAFDRAWSRAVLVEAMERLRAELREGQRLSELAVFEDYCFRDQAEVSYRDLGQRHGLSAIDVRNRLYQSRKRLRQILRALLREYLGGNDDVEAELALIVGK